jgi:hypothetical protein
LGGSNLGSMLNQNILFSKCNMATVIADFLKFVGPSGQKKFYSLK